MYEIRFHGRGGQGSVTASKILAEAAFFEDKWVTSFPFFGTERRGAPVTAFTRIDNERIELRSQIYEPDAVIVLDKSLIQLVNVTTGLKENGLVIINSKRDGLSKNKSYRTGYVDATSIALRNGLGDPSHPIVNTAILGAFSKVSNMVSLDSIKRAARDVSPKKIEENLNAIEEAYEEAEVC